MTKKKTPTFIYKTNSGLVAQTEDATLSAVDSNLEWTSKACLHKGYEWSKLATFIRLSLESLMTGCV